MSERTNKMNIMLKDGGPAFPEAHVVPGDKYNQPLKVYYPGMTLRDWFAGQALAGLLANEGADSTFEQYARVSYGLADAMLAARKKGGEV